MKHAFSTDSEDAKDVFHAVGILLVMAAGIVVLFFIFWLDATSSSPFSELAPTELIQSCVLLISSILFFIEAVKRPDMCGALVLTGGLVACMLIREQDYFLDFLQHGVWKWPALVMAIVCMAISLKRFHSLLSELAHLARWRYLPILMTGLVIVLVYSRLLGMGMLWKQLFLSNEAQWTAKQASEEASELLGYFLILFSAFLMRLERKRERRVHGSEPKKRDSGVIQLSNAPQSLSHHGRI